MKPVILQIQNEQVSIIDPILNNSLLEFHLSECQIAYDTRTTTLFRLKRGQLVLIFISYQRNRIFGYLENTNEIFDETLQFPVTYQQKLIYLKISEDKIIFEKFSLEFSDIDDIFIDEQDQLTIEIAGQIFVFTNSDNQVLKLIFAIITQNIHHCNDLASMNDLQDTVEQNLDECSYEPQTSVSYSVRSPESQENEDEYISSNDDNSMEDVEVLKTNSIFDRLKAKQHNEEQMQLFLPQHINYYNGAFSLLNSKSSVVKPQLKALQACLLTPCFCFRFAKKLVDVVGCFMFNQENFTFNWISPKESIDHLGTKPRFQYIVNDVFKGTDVQSIVNLAKTSKFGICGFITLKGKLLKDHSDMVIGYNDPHLYEQIITGLKVTFNKELNILGEIALNTQQSDKNFIEEIALQQPSAMF